MRVLDAAGTMLENSSDMARTMAWRTEGRLHVVVHGKRSPSNLEWASYLNTFRPFEDVDIRCIVVSHGGAPDGDQRKSLSQFFQQRRMVPPVALLTESLVARGVIAALSLFNPLMKAFGINDLQGAFNFVGLTPEERERASTFLSELDKELASAEQPTVEAR